MYRVRVSTHRRCGNESGGGVLALGRGGGAGHSCELVFDTTRHVLSMLAGGRGGNSKKENSSDDHTKRDNWSVMIDSSCFVENVPTGSGSGSSSSKKTIALHYFSIPNTKSGGIREASRSTSSLLRPRGSRAATLSGGAGGAGRARGASLYDDLLPAYTASRAAPDNGWVLQITLPSVGVRERFAGRLRAAAEAAKRGMRLGDVKKGVGGDMTHGKFLDHIGLDLEQAKAAEMLTSASSPSSAAMRLAAEMSGR